MHPYLFIFECFYCNDLSHFNALTPPPPSNLWRRPWTRRNLPRVHFHHQIMINILINVGQCYCFNKTPRWTLGLEVWRMDKHLDSSNKLDHGKNPENSKKIFVWKGGGRCKQFRLQITELKIIDRTNNIWDNYLFTSYIDFTTENVFLCRFELSHFWYLDVFSWGTLHQEIFLSNNIWYKICEKLFTVVFLLIHLNPLA